MEEKIIKDLKEYIENQASKELQSHWYGVLASLITMFKMDNTMKNLNK